MFSGYSSAMRRLSFYRSIFAFVRGVVDSNDLSLNISRELLQQDPNVAAIKSALTKRVCWICLERLVRDDADKYRERSGPRSVPC